MDDVIKGWTYFSTGYSPKTVKDLSVTLPFRGNIDTFFEQFGFRPDTNIRYTANPSEDIEEKITKGHIIGRIAYAPFFRKNNGRFFVSVGEDGWFYVHADPTAAVSFIKEYERKNGEGSYQAVQNEFAAYMEKYLLLQQELIGLDLKMSIDEIEVATGHAKGALYSLEKGPVPGTSELTDIVHEAILQKARVNLRISLARMKRANRAINRAVAGAYDAAAELDKTLKKYGRS